MIENEVKIKNEGDSKSFMVLAQKSGQYRGPRENSVVTVFFLCPVLDNKILEVGEGPVLQV